MRDIFETSLDQAMYLINKGTVDDFKAAIDIIHNLQAFIHDDKVIHKLDRHEEKIDKDVAKRLSDAKKAFNDRDPLYAYNDAVRYYVKIQRWQALELLSFFDKLRKGGVLG